MTETFVADSTLYFSRIAFTWFTCPNWVCGTTYRRVDKLRNSEKEKKTGMFACITMRGDVASFLVIVNINKYEPGTKREKIYVANLVTSIF